MNHHSIQLQHRTSGSVKHCISPHRSTHRRRSSAAEPRSGRFAEQARMGLRRSKADQCGELSAVVQALESEAVRRALSGVSVPVFHQGRECGSTVKHSDQLLIFLLKTLHPARYGGGKEAAASPDGKGRTFALEIDLSAANEAPGQEQPEGIEFGEGGPVEGEQDEGALGGGASEEGILY